MTAVLLVIHLILAIAMICVVLLQQSEGGGLGIGGGNGGGMGGFMTARGTANLLTRTTAILAVGFMATSITLAVIANQGRSSKSILDQPAPAAPANQQQVPALPQLPQLPSPSQN